MPPFIAGIELSRRFYHEAVRPIVEGFCPGLPHAAGHIGTGSDVLGFDTEMSTDHDWGPKAHIFLRDDDAHLADGLRKAFDRQLPDAIAGYPVRFPKSDDPENREQHYAIVTTLKDFCSEYLAYDLTRPMEVADWLTIPSQKLRTITAGAVHHDSVGELTRLREHLAYYPRDVWLYLLASGWRRIAQEEHLMPRAGIVGDELGSAIIGSRLARDVMALCFLMERQYAPYPKWFGTAFERLNCAADLTPILWRVQRAETWPEREVGLNEAYEYLARVHNRLDITPPMPETVSGFHTRPFKVIQGDQFADAIRENVVDPTVRRIASRRLIGSIDQFSDSTDLRSSSQWRPVLGDLYA
jgi:hypothetical protein